MTRETLLKRLVDRRMARGANDRPRRLCVCISAVGRQAPSCSRKR